MSQPWWGKEINAATVKSDVRRLVDGAYGKRPKLYATSHREIIAELRARRPEFVPEWSDPPDLDAGGALIDLFATQFASVTLRLNRLPDKSLVEFLNLAGIQVAPDRPSSALIQFELSQAARQSVPILKGFQVGARSATGSGDLVVFETQEDHFIAPARISKLIVARGANQRDVTSLNEANESCFAPLGDKPEIEDGLLIGLVAPPDATITETLSFGVRVAAAPGNPPPISAGGVAPIPLPVAPTLSWEARVKNQFQPVEVTRDETSSLWRSGIVTLRVPPGFSASRFIGDESLFWLRLRLVHGAFDTAPQLQFIRLNMARVEAVKSIRDEVLEPIDNVRSPNQMRLKNTPVVARSLIIEVEESALADNQESGQTNPTGRASVKQWTEVEELFSSGPTDEVFTVNPLTGVVTFGDGIHGASVPPGFRNVHAAVYKVGSGLESAVGSEEIKTLLNASPFLTGVTNPLPASGGVDNESSLEAIRRGPETIRAGNRSVTVADYAVMARFAPGADIRKAHAISGFHPLFRGQQLPGVVGVIVVPKVDEEGPPIPDEEALRAVARYLTEEVAPAGVEIVAFAPSYRRVRAEVGFVADRTADPSEIARNISDELDRYLHPLVGGNDDEGWPFGGTLFFSVLQQRLLRQVARLRAIPRLRLIVDGVPQGRCMDVPLGQTELFWPLDHQVIPAEAEAG